MGKTRVIDWGTASADRWTVIFPASHAYDCQRLIAGISALLNDSPREETIGYFWMNRQRKQGESAALVHLDRSLGSNDLVVKVSQAGTMGEVCKVIRHWRDSN